MNQINRYAERRVLIYITIAVEGTTCRERERERERKKRDETMMMKNGDAEI